jgi:ESS family glutamate:Na+ symporter
VVGGGFITALSVPLIDAWGLPVFTIVTAAVTVALTFWGMRRAAAGQAAFPNRGPRAVNP